MASNPDEVRQAAIAELARRELARRQAAPQKPSGPIDLLLSAYGRPSAATSGFAMDQLRSVSNLGQGALNAVTYPVDAGINIYNAVAGKNYPTTAQTREQFANQYVPPDNSGVGQLARAVNRGVGGAAVPIGVGSALAGSAAPVVSGIGQALASQPATQLASAATGSASGDVARQMGAPAWGQILASLAGGAVPVLGSAIAQRMAPNPNVPSADLLKDVAKDKFRAIKEDSTQAISQDDFRGMAQKMGATMEDFGLTSVQDVKDIYPKLGKAVGRITDAIESGKDVPINDVFNLRKLIKLSAGSPDKSERALAMGLTESLDNVVASATSLPAEARDLWRRSSNAEMVDRLAQRAADTTSQYTVSGYENALRNQFRNFVKSDKMRMLKPAEQDAMRQVAVGTDAGNLARLIGKLAPRGAISAGADMFLGGGGIGAAGLAGAGEISRATATALTEKNMRLAQEMMLTGGQQFPRPPIQWPLYGPLAGISANK